MTLLDLHIELALTNELLKRIADALDRAIPSVAQPDHSAHPLIGLADISRLTPERLAKNDAERATLPFRASERVFSKASVGSGSAAAGTGASSKAGDPAPAVSSVGQWDHDDPLDTLDEFDSEWPSNYAGVDR